MPFGRLCAPTGSSRFFPKFYIMSVSAYIAKHLNTSGEPAGTRSPAVAVASVGLALSFTVMMLTLAVTSGFKRQITEKISGFESQIRVTAVPSGYDLTTAPIYADNELRSQILEAVEPYADGDNRVEATRVSIITGLLKTSDQFAGLAIKAYAPEARMDFERSILIHGEIPAIDADNEIAISTATASALALNMGDKVNAYFIDDKGIRPRRFKIVGIFQSNFSEFDNMVAYCSQKAIRSIRRSEASQADAIEIRGLKPESISDATLAVQNVLSRSFAAGQSPQLLTASPITIRAAAYYNWLEMLDTNIVVIIVLMGFVSAFMIISCVLILVLKRVRTIGILKSLGATDLQIEKVFLYISCRVIFWGLLAGNIASLALIAAQHYLKLIPLNPENYYLSYVPVHFSLLQWGALNLAAAVLAMAVAMIPTILVKRLNPSTTMRWE